MIYLNNILSWIIFGSVVGTLGYIFQPGDIHKQDPIIMGIIGAVITGIMTSIIFNIPLSQFNSLTFLVALFGACLVIVGGMTLRNI